MPPCYARYLIFSVFTYGQASNLCCQELVKSKHKQYANFWISKSRIIKKITQTQCFEVYHIYKTWPVTTKSSIQSQFSGVHISPHEKKEVPSGNHFLLPFLMFFHVIIILSLVLNERRQAMLNFYKLSHDQACDLQGA